MKPRPNHFQKRDGQALMSWFGWQLGDFCVLRFVAVLGNARLRRSGVDFPVIYAPITNSHSFSTKSDTSSVQGSVVDCEGVAKFVGGGVVGSRTVEAWGIENNGLEGIQTTDE